MLSYRPDIRSVTVPRPLKSFAHSRNPPLSSHYLCVASRNQVVGLAHNYISHVTCHMAHFSCHMLHVTCHTLHVLGNAMHVCCLECIQPVVTFQPVTCHMSHVTCNIPHVTSHMSHVTCCISHVLGHVMHCSESMMLAK